MNVESLRERLEASRAALLAALEGVTERDFASELESGVTVVATLGALAQAERTAIRDARDTVGAAQRPLPAGGAAATARATPPQVVHDLAGARYETLLFLDLLAAARPATSGGATLATLLGGIADREIAAAEAVRSRIDPEGTSSA
jgi:hypothetical protein